MHVILPNGKSDSLIRCCPLLLLIFFLSCFWAIAAVDGTNGECSKEEVEEIRELLLAPRSEWPGPGTYSQNQAKGWSWTRVHGQVLRSLCVDLPGKFRARVIERLRRSHTRIDTQLLFNLCKLFFYSKSDSESENQQKSSLELKHENGDEPGEGLIKVCLGNINQCYKKLIAFERRFIHFGICICLKYLD